MYFEAFAKKPIQLRALSDGKIGRYCNIKYLAISCIYKKFTLNYSELSRLYNIALCYKK